MSSAPTWEDATSAAERIGPTEWRVLRLLALAPLLWPEPLGALSGLRVPALYAALARLQQLGLVGHIQRAWRPGRNPRLYHPSDLGVAVVATATGMQPAVFATQHHLWGRDLKTSAAGLPHLVRLYELLAEVVRHTEGYHELLAWQPPAPRLVPSSSGKSSVSVRLPAYLRLACDKGEVSWLLLLDAGGLPFDYHRLVIKGAARLRRRWGELPRLIVRTTHEARRLRWNDLLRELANGLGWSELLKSHVICSDSPLPADVAYRPLTATAGWGQRVAQARPHRSTLVPGTAGATTKAQLALAGDKAASLEPSELRVLDLLARHPFLTVGEVAFFGHLTTAEARAHVLCLVKAELLQKVAADVTPAGCCSLYEATAEGLRLAAARLGLSLRTAVPFCHLVGGGPDNPMGARKGLARTLAHTHGVNATIAEFVATAWVTSRIAGDGLLRWESEGAASDSEFRPDGYGIYRLDGRPHGFFLEFDRGTENRRDYEEKLGAYYRYRQVVERLGLYTGGFPTLLFVTADEDAEQRFADTARSLARSRTPLKMWLTTEARIHGEDNRFGVIGRIWRRPQDRVDDRRRWPPPQSTMSQVPAQTAWASRHPTEGRRYAARAT